jgi:hypothetical protein
LKITKAVVEVGAFLVFVLTSLGHFKLWGYVLHFHVFVFLFLDLLRFRYFFNLLNKFLSLLNILAYIFVLNLFLNFFAFIDGFENRTFGNFSIFVIVNLV